MLESESRLVAGLAGVPRTLPERRLGLFHSSLLEPLLSLVGPPLHRGPAWEVLLVPLSIPGTGKPRQCCLPNPSTHLPTA